MCFVQSQYKGNHKGGRPKAASFVLAVNTGAGLSVETQDMCLVESQDICLVETQDMCCVES